MSLSPRTRPATGLIVAGVLVIAILLTLALAAATGTDVRGALQAVIDSLFPVSAATAEGEDIRGLYDIVFFLAAAVFLVVEGLIIWTVIRYRRRPDDADLPPQTHGNNLAEMIWTIVPTLIVAFLFFVSWQTLNRVDRVSDESAVEVRAIAAQFQWQFEYLAEDGETVEFRQFLPSGQNGGLALPVGQLVRLHLVAPEKDVVHAFYVPRMLFKRDVIPGHENVFEFRINEDEAGQTIRGQCAELCGIGHRVMLFEIHAMTGQDFGAWLEKAKASVPPSPSPGGSAAPPATTLEISAKGLQFDKDALEAPAGQPFAIHFVNEDQGIAHDVAILGADGSLVFNGEDDTGGEKTYNVPPLEAGELKFICTFHANMTGTLTVK